MIFGANLDTGEGTIHLTPSEVVELRKGKAIKKASGDAKGCFTLTVKITRPKEKSKRFPEQIYGSRHG